MNPERAKLNLKKVLIILGIVIVLAIITTVGVLLFREHSIGGSDDTEPIINNVSVESEIGGIQILFDFGYTTSQYNQVFETLSEFKNEFLPSAEYLTYVPDSYQTGVINDVKVDEFQMRTNDEEYFKIAVDRYESMLSVNISIYNSEGKKLK